MDANQNIDLLRQAVSQRFGRKVEDEASSKQLSIEIFLKTGHYISKHTIAFFYGLKTGGRPLNPIILDFLAEYAGLQSVKVFSGAIKN